METPLPLPAIKKLIAELLPEGHPRIDQTARRLGIPVRTLQRRMREAGLSYRELVADVRFQAARRRLDDRKSHLRVVATRLGFADASSFSRAFRRWSGVSPRDFRRQRHRGLAARGDSGRPSRRGT